VDILSKTNTATTQIAYRNYSLGQYLKNCGLCEEAGSGIPEIHRAMKENHSPKVIFNNVQNGNHHAKEFDVTLPINKIFINEPQNEPQKSIEDLLIHYIHLNCKTTRKELASKIHKSLVTVKRTISKSQKIS
jgi:predicted HTH transcriptional regulator